MGALQNGADYRKTGRIEFPNGSFGNGGAMRIAPVGLVYRNASDDVLRQTVEAALLCTHVHPEAIDGAFIQAKAISILAMSDPNGFQPSAISRNVARSQQEFVVQRKLEILLEQPKEGVSDDEVITP